MQLNTIYNEDCLIGMKRIPDESIDMILCDLPYGTTRNKWDSIIPFKPLWAEYERIIKERGAIVLTASQPFTTSLAMSNQKLFRYSLVWDKQRTSGSLNANRMPLRAHEDILVFYKKLPTYNPQMTRGKMMSKGGGGGTSSNYGVAKPVRTTNDLYYPRSILKYKAPHNMQGKVHPTQKPVALMEYLIKTYTNEGETVLDNCAGSFTTAVACDNTNRNWICIEKEEEYCDIGFTRINNNRERLGLPTLTRIVK